jgi:hypothetical protein
MRAKTFGPSSFRPSISGITTNFFARMKICNVIMHNGLLPFEGHNSDALRNKYERFYVN